MTRNKLPLTVCPVCNKEFKKKKIQQECCSKICSGKKKTKTLNQIICLSCKKVFLGKAGRKCCSRKCAHLKGVQSKKYKDTQKKGASAAGKLRQGKTLEKILGSKDKADKAKKHMSSSYYKYFNSKKGKKEFKARNKKISASLKAKILEGSYTPNIENRLTRVSKKKFYFDGYNFRSSWELKFYKFLKSKYKKKDIAYEKLRIPYYDSTLKKMRVYIVDFLVNSINIVVEVKPLKLFNKQIAKDKENALIEYSKLNKLRYLRVSEEDVFNEFKSFQESIKCKK